MNIINLKLVNGSYQVLNDFITRGRQKTTLNANVAAASGTITVHSITGFSAGNYYALIGELGTGNAEIIKMHATTAPTGNTITLAANTAYAHDAGEPVYFVNYNQVEYSRATTTTGSKTALATQAITASALWSVYSDVTNTTGYAFARFKNEAGTTYSSYSAYSPYANPEFNTLEYIIDEAMHDANAKYNETITPDWLIKQANECLRDIRKEINKWSYSEERDYVLGQTSEGVFRYTLPTNIYDKYTHKAIQNVRIGENAPLIYMDFNEFQNLLEDVKYTQVTTAATAGDTTLYIDNSYDFDDDGSVTVEGNTITYTAVTRSSTAGALTGVPASGTGAVPAAGLSADSYVWQNETNSEPAYWTTWGGYLYIYPIPSSSYDNKNVYIDYFKVATAVDTMEDTIDYIQYDMVKNYLIWKIRSMAKDDGVLNPQDANYMLYREQLGKLKQKERKNTRFYFINGYESGIEISDDNPRKRRDG